MSNRDPDKRRAFASRKGGGIREWWLPLALLAVLVVFVVLTLTLSHRGVRENALDNGSGAGSGNRRSSVTPGAPIAEIKPMFIAGPGSLTDEFNLALVYVSERYPFPDIKLTHGYMMGHVSQTLNPQSDYIVFFFAPETGQLVKDEVWVRIRDAVEGVKDEQVFGIIENHSGKLTVFKERKGIARELERLRKGLAETDSAAPTETADGADGASG